jgi:magnesium-transporting ATPase (P-type)
VNGLCYINTSQLNGERSLEAKLAPTYTQQRLDQLKEGMKICFTDANGNLHQFSGKIDDHAVELRQFLPRGTVIKNSQDVVAVVVFTGNETKITMN